MVLFSIFAAVVSGLVLDFNLLFSFSFRLSISWFAVCCGYVSLSSVWVPALLIG